VLRLQIIIVWSRRAATGSAATFPNNIWCYLIDQFDIYNGGTIILFHPLTPAAVSWWKANVDPECIMMGANYAVECRYAPDIIEGIKSV